MAGVNKLLKEAQKMQDRIQAAQADLATKTFDASVAGGAVVATVNGQGQLVTLKIDPEFLKESADLVSSTIVEAVKQAQASASAAGEAIMGSFTSMMGPMRGLLG